MTTHYDVIIIGSGAGGGTMAHALAGSGAKILVVERGGFVPQEPENWSPDAVWKARRYRAPERWLDEHGREFAPYTHYCVGGNTKFWGGVLYRLRREDFLNVEHVDGVSPEWPIDYDTLAPFYDRAERLYQVRGDHRADPTEPPRGPFPFPPVPHSRRMAMFVELLRMQGLHPSPLPLGLLRPGEQDGCALCDTCNSFPCRIHAKSDVEICCLRRISSTNVDLWTHAEALRLEANGRGNRVEAVEVRRNGRIVRLHASLFIVSCGAVNSAALLLRSASASHPNGLANSSGLVGHRYMAHLTTMISAVPAPRNEDGFQRFQKTVGINDFYLAGPRSKFPLGHIQSQGTIHAAMIQGGAPGHLRGLTRIVPTWWLKRWTQRSAEWLVMTEDLPHVENRVTLQGDRIRLEYRPANRAAHEQLKRETRAILRRLGLGLSVRISFHSGNTTHQCGTLVFGKDPRASVLDPWCRAHDVDNLFVIDASFFPSSAAVNPGLTIVAQALRVADRIQDVHLR